MSLLWVIEVEWKRKNGKPVEPVAITTGGMLQALFLAKDISENLKIPASWVRPVLYRKCKLPKKKKDNVPPAPPEAKPFSGAHWSNTAPTDEMDYRKEAYERDCDLREHIEALEKKLEGK